MPWGLKSGLYLPRSGRFGYHLFDIFKQLAKLGHDRIRYLDDVVFEHMHYVIGKAACDSTYNKRNQRADDLLFIALDEDRSSKAKLLARYIKSRADSHLAGDGRISDETKRVVK